MNKRNYDVAFHDVEKKRFYNKSVEKKHTLDSDEEEEEEENVLDADDIEGEEEGVDRQEGDQKMTAFNMKEEMEEGHFDKDGHFIWNNEKEIRDNWLDNIDWQKIKGSASSKHKYHVGGEGLGADSDSEDDMVEDFDEIAAYKKVLGYMKPKETISKTLKRLAGNDIKLSSVERLRRKKAGTLHENTGVIELTALANEILTKMGNMDVYQETYEQIESKIQKSEGKNKAKAKEPVLDMYSEDFSSKEKRKMHGGPSTSSDSKGGDSNGGPSTSSDSKGGDSNDVKWEFKWKVDDEEVHGPYSNWQMVKWSKENYFKSGVLVRKHGEESNFYTSNRIDFELYE